MVQTQSILVKRWVPSRWAIEPPCQSDMNTRPNAACSLCKTQPHAIDTVQQTLLSTYTQHNMIWRSYTSIIFSQIETRRDITENMLTAMRSCLQPVITWLPYNNEEHQQHTTLTTALPVNCLYQASTAVIESSDLSINRTTTIKQFLFSRFPPGD